MHYTLQHDLLCVISHITQPTQSGVSRWHQWKFQDWCKWVKGRSKSFIGLWYTVGVTQDEDLRSKSLRGRMKNCYHSYWSLDSACGRAGLLQTTGRHQVCGQHLDILSGCNTTACSHGWGASTQGAGKKAFKTPTKVASVLFPNQQITVFVFVLRNTFAKHLESFVNVKRPATCCSPSCFRSNMLLDTPHILPCIPQALHELLHLQHCGILQGSLAIYQARAWKQLSWLIMLVYEFLRRP